MPDIQTIRVVLPEPQNFRVSVTLPTPLVTSLTVLGTGRSGTSGYSGFSSFSGYSGYSSLSGYSGFCGLSGYSGYSGSGVSGYSGYSGSGISGYSGYSGFCGLSGYSAYSGYCGLSGYSGFSSLSGYSGFCGSSGLSGYSGYSGSGISGYSGYSGIGTSGFSGYSGQPGAATASGFSGFCGLSGYSGYSGSGLSGYSGYSGSGTSGYSGFCGLSGYSGYSSTSGYSGYSSTSGYSGYCGLSGYSGFSGKSGYSGYSGSGTSGYSGYSGLSGYSGYSSSSGYSGFSSTSGYSGFSGSGVSGYSGYSGYSGAIGIAGTQPYWPQDTASDIGTYNDILTTPESGTEATASAVCNNNQVLIQAYASPSVGLGLTLIPSGEWTFDFFASVTSLSLASDLVIKVYSRTSGGSETLLFTTTSPTFTSTSVTEYEWSVIEPEYAINTTDRLVIKVYGETAIPLNTTVAYTYLGQTHYSRIITSFVPIGISGYSGFSGKSGYSGYSSTSGYSGYSSVSGYSGFCGKSGYSGFSGGGGSFLENNIARVDASGNDGTGTIGDLTKPFLTVAAAVAAWEAISLNLPAFIHVGSNEFSEDITTALRDVTFIGDSFYLSNVFNSITLSPTTGNSVNLRILETSCGQISAALSGGLFIALEQAVIEAPVANSTGAVQIASGPHSKSYVGDNVTAAGDMLFQNTTLYTTISAPGFNIQLINCPPGSALSDGSYDGVVTISSDASEVWATGTVIGTVTACGTLHLVDSRVQGTNSASSTVYADVLLKDFSGYSGYCGLSGYSGYSGKSGYSGYSGSGLSGYSGYCGLSGYSGFSSISGYSGYSSTSGYSGYSGSGTSGYSGYCGLSGQSGYSGYSGPAINKLLLTQNVDLGLVAGTVVSKAGTVTGAVGVGSSLFLGRMMVPAAMTLTEIQAAISIGFQATNNGQGTMSRSMVVYSFGNSTSLASVLSISGTSAWTSGTSTAGGSGSLTQFQGGWSTPLIQPMTFGSSALPPGEYVVGQLFNFAQLNSTWTLAFYGDIAASTFLASAATNLTSASLGALSSGGLAAVSAHTGTTGTAVTAWTAAASFMGVGKVGSTASFSAAAASSVMATATANSTLSLLLNTGTAALGLLSSAGFSAGSFIGTSGSVGAVTNVALGALNSSTLAQLTQPNFGFIGTGSTTSGFPTVFIAGIMSTGAIPTAISLTSAAVTYSGSFAFQQPWFALVGS